MVQAPAEPAEPVQSTFPVAPSLSGLAGMLPDVAASATPATASISTAAIGSLDPTEVIRLTLQLLRDLGLSSSASALELETGVALEDPAVSTFRKYILSGRFAEAENALDALSPDVISSRTDIVFLLRQQQYIELLQAGDVASALALLRGSLAPLATAPARVALLASLATARTPMEIEALAGTSTPRSALLASIEQHVAPSAMLREHRLQTLLEYAKAHQRARCMYHAEERPMSLLADCNCKGAVPRFTTTHVLDAHVNEVWRAAFSHNGKLLATSSSDRTVILWDTSDFSQVHVLGGHSDAVACLAWSPDDETLLTSSETTIKVWTVATGGCVSTLTPHEYPIGALAWKPDGSGFVTGGSDPRIVLWSLAGDVLGVLPNSPSRVIDLAISPDGRHLVAAGRKKAAAPNMVAGSGLVQSATDQYERKIYVYDLEQSKLLYTVNQPGELTSVSISEDSRYALISEAPNKLIILDINTACIIQTFSGHDQANYILKSCFGGRHENFVLSGSEDGLIYIWHRHLGTVIAKLEGHSSGSVNAIAWNKAQPTMFASVSDDHTVRIWKQSFESISKYFDKL